MDISPSLAAVAPPVNSSRADEKVSLHSDVSARYKIDGWNREKEERTGRRDGDVRVRAGAARLAHFPTSLSDERTEKGP